jgi:hypothetical protein
MIAFTVWGFLSEGGKYLDFSLDICADSPAEAMEKIMAQHWNLVVSGVCRASSGKFVDY